MPRPYEKATSRLPRTAGVLYTLLQPLARLNGLRPPIAPASSALLTLGALFMPDTPVGTESSPPRRVDPDSFNGRVYAVVRRIPRGKVTTYGTIAEALGDPRKAREVGWALFAKPKEEKAPAHRVVNREGKLSGGWAFGGVEVQRSLLEDDGVTFRPDGAVDMDKHLWRPEECDDARPHGEPSLFDLLGEEGE